MRPAADGGTVMLVEPPRFGRPLLDAVSVLVALVLPAAWLAALDRALRRTR